MIKILRAKLKPGGYLLGALPNVRHISVLRNLLLRGEFRYEDSGIMDWTHLRFFTRKSMIELVEGGDLELVDIRGDLNGTLSKALYTGSATLMRDFSYFAYNFLARRPTEPDA